MTGSVHGWRQPLVGGDLLVVPGEGAVIGDFGAADRSDFLESSNDPAELPDQLTSMSVARQLCYARSAWSNNPEIARVDKVVGIAVHIGVNRQGGLPVRTTIRAEQSLRVHTSVQAKYDYMPFARLYGLADGGFFELPVLSRESRHLGDFYTLSQRLSVELVDAEATEDVTLRLIMGVIARWSDSHGAWMRLLSHMGAVTVFRHISVLPVFNPV